MGRRRVVITGAGVRFSSATTRDELWQLVSQPFDPARLSHGFPSAAVLPVTSDLGVTRKERQRLSRSSQLALAASREALRDAGLGDGVAAAGYDPYRCGVALGAGTPAVVSVSDAVAAAVRGGGPAAAYYSTQVASNQRVGAIAQAAGLHGPSRHIGTACASGGDALAEGFDLITAGRCDLVVAGGVDNPLDDVFMQSMVDLRVAAHDGVSTPFCLERHGFTFAEGSAVVVLEAEDHAQRRGAPILADMLGWNATCDGFHIATPDPSGEPQRRCVRGALDDAGVAPEAVTTFLAHGTATSANDRIEAELVRAEFPEADVVAIKPAIGHPFGASATAAAVVAVEIMRRGRVPGMVTQGTADSQVADLRIAFHDGDWRPGPTVAFAMGMGGANSAVVLGPRPSTATTGAPT